MTSHPYPPGGEAAYRAHIEAAAAAAPEAPRDAIDLARRTLGPILRDIRRRRTDEREPLECSPAKGWPLGSDVATAQGPSTTVFH